MWNKSPKCAIVMAKASPYSYELEGTLLVMVEETSPFFEPILSCEENPSYREGSLWTSTSNTSCPFVTEDIEEKGETKSSEVVMVATRMLSS